MSNEEKNRLNFRVELHEPLTVEWEDKQQGSLVRVHGTIHDISGGGISFTLFEQLPLLAGERFLVTVSFSICETTFCEKAHVLREITTRNGHHLYAAKFEKMPKMTQSELVTLLLKIDFEKRFKKRKKN